MAGKVFDAVLRARCRWWCSGRFWATHVDLHPIFSTVITALARITNWNMQWSSFLERNFKQFFDAVDLDFVAHNEERGVQFRRRDDEVDRRVLRVFGRRKMFWSDEELVPHLLRQVCRARALTSVKRTRYDSEGIDDVDLEVQSCKPWQRFRDSLTDGQSSLLQVFRCGAVSTETRRAGGPLPECQLCGQPVSPSMRHLVAECGHFDALRRQMNMMYSITDAWWARQPRVTLKTGWITFGAHQQVLRRADLQVAVCRMGLAILETTGRRSQHN